MPVGAPTDFFHYQDVARKRTSWLVAFYALAVVLIIAGVYIAFIAVFMGAALKAGGAFEIQNLWQPATFMWVAGITLAIVVAGTFYKIDQLKAGGEAVAVLLGGRPIDPGTPDIHERKILNVVAEMAIASGTPVPRVFLLEGEEGINAFAAGFSPADAVIGVTRGCIMQLNRDELQGVIAHEFSHILNGDMRLNIELIGILNGILIIALIGYWTMRSLSRSRSSSSSGKGGGAVAAIALFGLLLTAIGYIGVFFAKLIKSAVSRQREYLADASSVELTRNPTGLASALAKISSDPDVLEVASRATAHLYIVHPIKKFEERSSSIFDTHPPIKDRIARLMAMER